MMYYNPQKGIQLSPILIISVSLIKWPETVRVGINGWFLLSVQVRLRSQLGPLARNSIFWKKYKRQSASGSQWKELHQIFSANDASRNRLWDAYFPAMTSYYYTSQYEQSTNRLRISRKQVMKTTAVSRTKHNCKFKSINNEGNLWNILKKFFLKYCVFFYLLKMGFLKNRFRFIEKLQKIVHRISVYLIPSSLIVDILHQYDTFVTINETLLIYYLNLIVHLNFLSYSITFTVSGSHP